MTLVEALDVTLSANPELVDQHLPHRVVLVVADALRDDVDDLRADERHPGRLVDGLAVSALPQPTCGVRVRRLLCLGFDDPTVDPGVAESRGVRVRRAGQERGTREE